MITITFKRDKGAVKMCVDARDFVEYLKTLGCTQSTTGYLDNYPYLGESTVDIANSRLAPKVLCRCDGPHEYDLASLYRNPPTSAALQKIGESAEEVARLILDHYRPVEIKVRVVPKVPTPTATATPDAIPGNPPGDIQF